MGSTKFEGGLLQKCLQVKAKTLPQTKDYNYLQKITSVTMFTKIQRDTKIQKIQQDVSDINTLAKHAPIALTLLDCLHWQP
jgi:hypothetical protein